MLDIVPDHRPEAHSQSTGNLCSDLDGQGRVQYQPYFVHRLLASQRHAAVHGPTRLPTIRDRCQRSAKRTAHAPCAGSNPTPVADRQSDCTLITDGRSVIACRDCLLQVHHAARRWWHQSEEVTKDDSAHTRRVGRRTGEQQEARPLTGHPVGPCVAVSGLDGCNGLGGIRPHAGEPFLMTKGEIGASTA